MRGTVISTIVALVALGEGLVLVMGNFDRNTVMIVTACLLIIVVAGLIGGVVINILQEIAAALRASAQLVETARVEKD